MRKAKGENGGGGGEVSIEIKLGFMPLSRGDRR